MLILQFLISGSFYEEGVEWSHFFSLPIVLFAVSESRGGWNVAACVYQWPFTIKDHHEWSRQASLFVFVRRGIGARGILCKRLWSLAQHGRIWPFTFLKIWVCGNKSLGVFFSRKLGPLLVIPLLKPYVNFLWNGWFILYCWNIYK